MHDLNNFWRLQHSQSLKLFAKAYNEFQILDGVQTFDSALDLVWTSAKKKQRNGYIYY